jgi:hypothetical protein
MNELVKRGLDWLQYYWHKKPLAVLAPIVASLVILWFFYSPEPKKIPIFGWISSVAAGVLVLVIWLVTNRLPRIAKGNTGIVIGILCENPEEDKQVKIDFVANLRQLVQQGGNRFQLVELPSWSLEGIESPTVMERLLHKVRGHFLLYGRVRLRNKDGKPAHLLSFEGMVRHRQVSPEVSEELKVDFSRILPRRIVIEKDNDAFHFEATAEWTDVSAHFIIGTAALISGDVAYAENLLQYVESKLKRERMSGEPIKEISRRLPYRFSQLYAAWLANLYNAYFITRKNEYLDKCDDVCPKLLRYDLMNRNAMMVSAICEFVLRKDVSAAHKWITKCRNDSDSTWLYCRAFLHAYQGKMDEAMYDYKNAFKGSVVDQSVPIQCEEFIHIVLSQEPHRAQLYFCLGLINFHAKQDYTVAAEDLRQFLSKVKDGEFKREVAKARELLSKCALKTE